MKKFGVLLLEAADGTIEDSTDKAAYLSRTAEAVEFAVLTGGVTGKVPLRHHLVGGHSRYDAAQQFGPPVLVFDRADTTI
jgi:hypothetical protein